MSTFLYQVLQRRSIFFYLLFLGYLAFGHPYLIARLSKTDNGGVDILLGWFLLGLLFLELLGFWLKHPIMVYYARRFPVTDTASDKFMAWVDPSSGFSITLLMVIFLPILHLCLAFFLYFVGTQIGGLNPGGSALLGRQLLFVAGFFVVLLKECGMIGLFYSPYGLRGLSNDTYPTLGWRGLTNGVYPSELRLGHLLRDAAGDVILLTFSAVAYTVLWDFLGIQSPLYASSFWGYVLAYLGLGIYFLMTILPLQSVYFFQAATTRQTKTQRIWLVTSILLLVLVAFISFPRIG